METQREQVRAIASDHGVDAVYERLSLFGESGVRVAEELGLPHVLEVNAPLCEEARRFRVLPHPEEAVRIEARVLAATDRVFVVSAALAERLGDDGIDATRISVTPNAIDPAKFGLRRRSRADRTFTIGFAGSLKPWHGIDVPPFRYRRV